MALVRKNPELMRYDKESIPSTGLEHVSGVYFQPGGCMEIHMHNHQPDDGEDAEYFFHICEPWDFFEDIRQIMKLYADGLESGEIHE